jgi:hypothetical protein
VKEERFQRDVVILGETATAYRPSLTMRGFRYVSVEDADPLGPDDAVGIVMSSDIERIARFESSDPRLEQLWRNAMWSLRSNFLDTPTVRAADGPATSGSSDPPPSNYKGLARRFGRRYGRHERYIVDSGFHLGEWLRPGEGSTWARPAGRRPASAVPDHLALLARADRTGRNNDLGEGYDKDGNARDSHNHHAFGSVVRFLHEYVAGLAPAAPGYREILFAPAVGHGPSGRGPQSADVEIDTPYGIASSR